MTVKCNLYNRIRIISICMSDNNKNGTFWLKYGQLEDFHNVSRRKIFILCFTWARSYTFLHTKCTIFGLKIWKLTVNCISINRIRISYQFVCHIIKKWGILYLFSNFASLAHEVNHYLITNAWYPVYKAENLLLAFCITVYEFHIDLFVR